MVAAALLNALELVKKQIGEVKVVINSAGSAGVAIGKHLIFCDRFGIVCAGGKNNNPVQEVINDETIM